MEVSLSLPQITAAGFFDIDCKLLPTVRTAVIEKENRTIITHFPNDLLQMVGTTLTYLIILYQFDSNEK